MAHGKRMSALKYVWKTMIRMSDLWNDHIESTNFISRITGTDRSSAWMIHDQRKDTAKAVSFLAFKHYDPNAWFESDGSKIQVSILLGTVYRKSDTKELWKTLKNSEYSNFHTLRVIHSTCQCPQSGDTHFYPASLEPAYLTAFRARFCRYFSEYSDNWPKTRLKVGRRQIVLFWVYFRNFLCSYYSRSL